MWSGLCIGIRRWVGGDAPHPPTGLVTSSLTQDNHVWAAGTLWQRTDAILMRGSFSAQCADLHCLGPVSKGFSPEIIRQTYTARPVPLWKTTRGNTVSLSHFRDNVNIAAKGPTASSEMAAVCAVLSICWNLPVLCPCIPPEVNVCDGHCMGRQLHLLGLMLHVGTSPICYATPSSLTSDWKLKWGPSLQSSWAMTASSPSNIFTGSLVNTTPFFFFHGLACCSAQQRGCRCQCASTQLQAR